MDGNVSPVGLSQIHSFLREAFLIILADLLWLFFTFYQFLTCGILLLNFLVYSSDFCLDFLLVHLPPCIIKSVRKVTISLLFTRNIQYLAYNGISTNAY